jgi:hypothetical protein
MRIEQVLPGELQETKHPIETDALELRLDCDRTAWIKIRRVHENAFGDRDGTVTTSVFSDQAVRRFPSVGDHDTISPRNGDFTLIRTGTPRGISSMTLDAMWVNRAFFEKPV